MPESSESSWQERTSPEKARHDRTSKSTVRRTVARDLRRWENMKLIAGIATTKSGNQIFSGLMVLLISIFLGFAFWGFINVKSFIVTAQIADGIIIGFETRPGSFRISEGVNCPVVRFSTAASNEVTFRSNISSTPSPFRVGQSVQVYYRPANPKDARIKHFGSLWFKPLLFAGMALVPIFFLLCFWLRRFNEK